MKLVKANFAFRDRVTGELHKPDDEPFEMTEERLAEVRAVDANLVYVVGDVEEPEEDAEPTELEGQEEPVEPVADSELEASDEDAQQTEPVVPEEPKQTRKRKPKDE